MWDQFSLSVAQVLSSLSRVVGDSPSHGAKTLKIAWRSIEISTDLVLKGEFGLKMDFPPIFLVYATWECFISEISGVEVNQPWRFSWWLRSWGCEGGFVEVARAKDLRKVIDVGNVLKRITFAFR